jgi:hypothetical protein
MEARWIMIWCSRIGFCYAETRYKLSLRDMKKDGFNDFFIRVNNHLNELIFYNFYI